MTEHFHIAIGTRVSASQISFTAKQFSSNLKGIMYNGCYGNKIIIGIANLSNYFYINSYVQR